MSNTEKRELLKDLFDEFTSKQTDYFAQYYKSIEDIPDNKLDYMIDRAKLTVENNRYARAKGF